MNATEKHISDLIHGKAPLKVDMANKLEMVLGVPASFWNNLEQAYRERLQIVEFENGVEKDFSILEKLPVKDLLRKGVITVEDEEDGFALVIALRKFFGLVSLQLLEDSRYASLAKKRYKNTEQGKQVQYALHKLET